MKGTDSKTDFSDEGHGKKQPIKKTGKKSRGKKEGPMKGTIVPL